MTVPTTHLHLPEEDSYFSKIKIEKSGKELKDACKATLNRHEFEDKLSKEIRARLEILSRNLVDKYRYEISIDEAKFLGL